MTHWIITAITIIVVALLMTFGIQDLIKYHCETPDGLLLFRGIALVLLGVLAAVGINRDNN